MNFLLALFLVCLGSGALAMLVAAPRDELGAGFFRLIGYFFGGVLLLGAAVGQPGAEGPPPGLWSPLLNAAAVLAVVHVLALRSGHGGVESGSRFGAVAAGLAGSTLLARALLEVPGTAGLAALALTVLSSAALLGSTAVGMLCGHWYLIDRKLDFWILRRFTKLLAAGVAAKGVTIAAGLALWPQALPEATVPLTALGSLPNILLLARTGLGVGLVGALTYMVWDCVKRESNQSATGLLYVTLAVVLGCEALGLGIAVVSGGVWL